MSHCRQPYDRSLRKVGGDVRWGRENPIVITTGRVTRATQRLGELKTAGVQLSELLGGEAGAAFIRDDCGGDPEVAYAALALVFSPTAHKRWLGEEG
jgi:hypothetical protein